MMPRFEVIDARSPQEAVRLLRKYGPRAELLASGTDVFSLLKDGIAGSRVPVPEILVNLAGIEGLRGIAEDPRRGLLLGAMTRLFEVIEHEGIRARYGLLAQAASRVASPQLRNTSTLAGNLCQRPRCWYFRAPEIVCLKKGGSACWAVEGDNRYYHAILEGGPCHIVHPSDLAPALIALDASLEILGPQATRTLLLESFFVTTAQDVYRENVLGDQEMITRIRVPPPPPESRQIFVKATVRQGDEFALASAAVVVRTRAGLCEHVRIVLGGVSPRPYRARAAEASVLGREITAAAIRTAANRAVEAANPMSGNAYKVDLARNLVRRALDEAMETLKSQPSQSSNTD